MGRHVSYYPRKKMQPENDPEDDEVCEQLGHIYAAAVIVYQAEQDYAEHPESEKLADAVSKAIEAYDRECDEHLALVRRQLGGG